MVFTACCSRLSIFLLQFSGSMSLLLSTVPLYAATLHSLMLAVTVLQYTICFARHRLDLLIRAATRDLYSTQQSLLNAEISSSNPGHDGFSSPPSLENDFPMATLSISNCDRDWRLATDASSNRWSRSLCRSSPGSQQLLSLGSTRAEGSVGYVPPFPVILLICAE